jgi:hypothetical protein
MNKNGQGDGENRNGKNKTKKCQRLLTDETEGVVSGKLFFWGNNLPVPVFSPFSAYQLNSSFFLFSPMPNDK